MVAWNLFDADQRATYRDTLGFVDDAMWLRGRAWATSAAIQALPYYRHTNPDIVAPLLAHRRRGAGRWLDRETSRTTELGS